MPMCHLMETHTRCPQVLLREVITISETDRERACMEESDSESDGEEAAAARAVIADLGKGAKRALGLMLAQVGRQGKGGSFSMLCCVWRGLHVLVLLHFMSWLPCAAVAYISCITRLHRCSSTLQNPLLDLNQVPTIRTSCTCLTCPVDHPFVDLVTGDVVICTAVPQAGRDGEAAVVMAAWGARYRLSRPVLRYSLALSGPHDIGGAPGYCSVPWPLPSSGPEAAKPYVRAIDGALPDHLLAHMVAAFGPGAGFWRAHEYNPDGSTPFFSYVHPLPPLGSVPEAEADSTLDLVGAFFVVFFCSVFLGWCRDDGAEA